MRRWVIAALLGVSVCAGGEPIVELAFERDRVVVQGRNECFPSSIYNVLQTAKRALPNYEQFLRAVGERPARRRPDCPRFQSARTEFCDFEGTRNDEQRAMVFDAVTEAGVDPLEAGFFARRAGERQQTFIRRIHGEILTSLRAGLPVVSRLLLYQGDGQYFNHANMIFGISEEPFLDREKGWSFRMKIFEQEWGGGMVLEVLVHERVRRDLEPFITRNLSPAHKIEFRPEWRVHDGWAFAFAEVEMRRADGGWQPLYAREGDAGRLAPVFLELAFGRFQEANLVPAYPAAGGTVTASVEAE